MKEGAIPSRVEGVNPNIRGHSHHQGRERPFSAAGEEGPFPPPATSSQPSLQFIKAVLLQPLQMNSNFNYIHHRFLQHYPNMSINPPPPLPLAVPLLEAVDLLILFDYLLMMIVLHLSQLPAPPVVNLSNCCCLLLLLQPSYLSQLLLQMPQLQLILKHHLLHPSSS